MKKENNGKLRIIPLGGLEKIVMNITAFEYEDSIIVVDCGLAFPEDDMLGIDLVIPDVTYLKDNIQKVKGFVITHGHEDHIGALSYILREMNLPIYATKLTMGIIERKLSEHNLLRSTRRKVVKHGQSINLGQFRIEFIKTNHSIQDAAALAIYSPAGIVVHTGDFKVDYTPVFGDAIDLQRLEKKEYWHFCQTVPMQSVRDLPSQSERSELHLIIFLQNIRIRESSLRLSRQMWIVYSRLSTLHANMTERL